MNIEPLSLLHQELLETRLHQMNLSLSEYTFANLYLFRQIHHYEVVKIEQDIFIKGLTRDKIPFIMLTQHPSKIAHSILRKAFSLVSIFFPVPDDWLNDLKTIAVEASFKEEESDYLYSQFKLANYPGRRLDGKRNQIKQLLNNHQVKSESFSQQIHETQTQHILHEWQKEQGENASQTDYFSCQEAISNFHRLHLHGRIAYVDGKPAGFVIGEWISKECYVVHFCKASKSIKGLYQYLLQDLAQSLGNACSWLNLEQDLGIPNLRRSKLSYLPDQLLNKWRMR